MCENLDSWDESITSLTQFEYLLKCSGESAMTENNKERRNKCERRRNQQKFHNSYDNIQRNDKNNWECNILDID